MGADNLPLPALFEEDQGRSAVDAPGLAVFGYARKQGKGKGSRLNLQHFSHGFYFPFKIAIN